MRKGRLSEFFVGVAVKRLSAVEANPEKSNQHEYGTSAAMRRFLGSEKTTYQARYLWIGDEQDSFSADGTATHYDCRENQPRRRPEWRIYYPTNAVTAAMSEGDTLFVAKRPDGDLLFIVVAPGSVIQNQLLWLFGFDAQPDLSFSVVIPGEAGDAALDFSARIILDEIGVEFEDPNADRLDEIVARFGIVFPTTLQFSDLARLTLPEVDARDDPDAALVAWLFHEEAMFRRLERNVVEARLRQGFETSGSIDVDGFLSFSLSVQNRRKSRMGRALENHLAALFAALDVKFTPQGRTEQSNTPDFLFPGVSQYHDPLFPPDQLTMLAAKSTCKERWRQVLPEADRIPAKHLVTLEPGITTSQTDQMRRAGLQLVLPAALHASYSTDQQAWLFSIADFTALVLHRQANG